MSGILLAASPLLGLTIGPLAALFCVFLLLGAEPGRCLATIASVSVGGLACALVGNYISIAAGDSSHSKLYARAGAFLGVGAMIADPSFLQSIATALTSSGEGLTFDWRNAGRLGTQMCVAVCKVSLALSILSLIIELPIEIFVRRSSTGSLGFLTAVRPFVLIGLCGVLSSYIGALWSNLF